MTDRKPTIQEVLQYFTPQNTVIQPIGYTPEGRPLYLSTQQNLPTTTTTATGTSTSQVTSPIVVEPRQSLVNDLQAIEEANKQSKSKFVTESSQIRSGPVATDEQRMKVKKKKEERKKRAKEEKLKRIEAQKRMALNKEILSLRNPRSVVRNELAGDIIPARSFFYLNKLKKVTGVKLSKKHLFQLRRTLNLG